MKHKKGLLILVIVLVVLAVVFGLTFDYIKGYYIKKGRYRADTFAGL